jgi:hypothetical protein
MNEFITLIHAQWRSMRLFFGLLTAFVVLSTLFAFMIELNEGTRAMGFRGSVDIALGCLIAGQTIWLILVLIAQSGTGDLTFSLPVYLTRLPVNAWKLAVARMAFALGCNLLLASAGIVLYYILFETRTVEEAAYFEITMGFAITYTILQAAAWWIGPANIPATLGTIISGWVVLVVHAARFKYEPIWEVLFAKFDSLPAGYAAITALVIIIGSFVVGAGGIAQHRKGRFAGLRERLFSRRAGRSTTATLSSTFSSPESAIQWLEYRRNWRFFPWFMAMLFFAIAVFNYNVLNAIYTTVSPPEGIDNTLAGLAGLSAYFTFNLAIAGMIGIFLFRLWRRVYGQDDSFVFYRPMTTPELVMARWKANMRYALLGCIPLAGILIVATFLNVHTIGGVTTSTFGHLTVQNHAILIFFIYLSVFIVGCLMVWAVLTPEMFAAMIVVSSLVAISVSSIDAMAALAPETKEQYPLWIGLGNILAYGSPVVIAIFLIRFGMRLFSYVKKNGLVLRKPLFIICGLLPIATIGIFFTANLDMITYKKPLQYWEPLFLLPVFLIAVFAPVFTTPAVTHWVRHRK